MKPLRSPGMGVADDPNAARPTLHDCIEAVLQQGDGLMGHVLDGLKVAAARPQGKGINGGMQPAVKAAIEVLAAQAAAVRASFVAQLRVAIYSGGGGSSAAEKPLLRFDDLHMLEADQLDESIELARALQEVVLTVDGSLGPLDSLISTLLGWNTIQAHLNPLRPDVFVRALRDGLEPYVASGEVLGALLTPAAGLMGVRLSKQYREIVDWLRSQGIEPASTGGPTMAMPLGGRVAAVENSVTKTLLTLDKLRRLLSGELDADGVSPAARAGLHDFLHTVPASLTALQDMKQVETLMQRLVKRVSAPETAPPPAERRQIARELSNSKKLGKQLGEEVVRLMTDNLMQDERLLPRVRQTLKGMEPVLLKLAQTDPRFFSEKQHPARQLLDRMTHRSLGYSSEGDEGFNRFLHSIDEASRILAMDDGESAPFATVLLKLEKKWEREDESQKQHLEEAARALLHAEQRNLLAQRVSEDFAARMKNREVPQVVVDFLRGPWPQVVAESQLSEADGTPDPHGYLALVDDLIWSVRSRSARRNRARLVQMVPTLLVKLREGSQLIGYPEERVSAFFDALIALHEEALEGGRAKPKDASSGEADTVFGEAGDSVLDGGTDSQPPDSEVPWMGDQEAKDSGYLEEDSVMPIDFSNPQEPEDAGKPRAWSSGTLPTGAWVELMLEGKWVRAQLTWASPHRTLFMFISGAGLAHSMSRRTMERLRVQGMIRVVSDGHLVDNALDGVAQVALQNSLDKKPQGQ